ncbi:BatD family protein [Xanthobacter sp. TB0139]|uniref:BatD family protein n=1 Tax=Xanthobacter sp. TB0139 TaxID=3459178 RepID=UPI004039F111
MHHSSGPAPQLSRPALRKAGLALFTCAVLMATDPWPGLSAMAQAHDEDHSNAPLDAPALTSRVDRTVVAAGESFNYVLTLANGQGRSPPDLTPLLKDFEVVDRRRASRAEMKHGHHLHLDEWVITLQPKRLGTLTIPPLTVNGLTSRAARVQVVPAAPLKATGDAPLFVRVAAGAGPAFAQSDIPVTVRIYDRIGMVRGSMEKPVAEGATFTEDGDQRQYLKTIDNKRYRVLEQSYLMRPQRSGEIRIEPLRLEATVSSFQGSSAASDMAGVLGRGMDPGHRLERNLTVRSQPVSITVQPRPEGAKGWFLPARNVTLREEWSTPPDKARVGQLLTRTLILEAKGSTSNQLPPLSISPVAGLRQYEDHAEAENVWVGDEMGTRLEKVISIMPTQPGTMDLPAIDVPWWNLTTHQQENTRLPAITLKVEGDVMAAAVPPAAAPDDESTASSASPSSILPEQPPMQRLTSWLGPVWQQVRPHWAVLGTATFGALALILLALGLKRRRAASQPRQPEARSPKTAPDISEEEAFAALEIACKAHNATQAHAAFLRWKQQAPRTIWVESPIPAELEHLRQHLYGNAPGLWNGAGLLKALRRARKIQKRAPSRPHGARLAPLYPEA